MKFVTQGIICCCRNRLLQLSHSPFKLAQEEHQNTHGVYTNITVNAECLKFN